MANISGLLDVLKITARDAVNSTSPVRILFGEVTSVNPLTITVDQKLVLTSEFLVLCREVTDYDLEMTVNHTTEKMQGGGKDPSFKPHKHMYKGKKVFRVHKALKLGEKVVLAALQGGQTFVVIDRLQEGG